MNGFMTLISLLLYIYLSATLGSSVVNSGSWSKYWRARANKLLYYCVGIIALIFNRRVHNSLPTGLLQSAGGDRWQYPGRICFRGPSGLHECQSLCSLVPACRSNWIMACSPPSRHWQRSPLTLQKGTQPWLNMLVINVKRIGCPIKKTRFWNAGYAFEYQLPRP